MIAHLGPAKAEAWIPGVKANLARKPAGGDREQMRDVAAGQCDIAIANTYYMALMQTDTAKPEQKKWAAAVRIVLPNAADRGSHVNIAGAVVARYAPHKANAVKLIEFLASDEGQKLYADMVFEYPLRQAWRRLRSCAAGGRSSRTACRSPRSPGTARRPRR